MKSKDKCQSCRSESLFDTDVEEGYEGTFVTVCLNCGKVQGKPKIAAVREP